jgi:hypothetical protein
MENVLAKEEAFIIIYQLPISQKMIFTISFNKMLLVLN